MKNDTYRDPQQVSKLRDRIQETISRPWSLMEICGGQTHAFLKSGLDQLLPEEINLIHGPGCPVCVTPISLIDQAIALASRDEVVLCSFGDMLRVPGSSHSLMQSKTMGADVKIVYSPLDAIALAQKAPHKQIVFFSVGFETTAPTSALLVARAAKLKLTNLSLLVSHVRVPPALEMILSAPDNQVQGVMAAGHVCSIMGTHEYLPIARQYRTPIVVTGFEAVDLLLGVYRTLVQLEHGQYQVENAYPRYVKPEGNSNAQALMKQVFDIVDREWRGFGNVPGGGLQLTSAYQEFDAMRRFSLSEKADNTASRCRSAEILTGKIKPAACELFGTECTPANPAGAPMVSAEGVCHAYYQYRARKQAC